MPRNDDPAGTIRAFVPGRLEVLGKHTDYAGGLSLTCAVDRGFSLRITPSDGGTLDVGEDELRSIPISPDVVTNPGRWTHYPATVVRRVARDFPSVRSGGVMRFSSDLPSASGLSSSSAMIISTLIALDVLNEGAISEAFADPLDFAHYAAAVESGRAMGSFEADFGVGTAGGSQDHTAILDGRPGRLSLYRYRPTARCERIALDPDCRFVVASSGVRSRKTGPEMVRFNRASELASLVAERLDPDAECLREAVDRVGLQQALDRSGEWDRSLAKRLRHYIEESERIIPEAVRALNDRDLTAFGTAVDASQRAAEDLLGNQVPETVCLHRIARQRGALAASAFGAGFGGSVWALVSVAKLDSFLREWEEEYTARYPDRIDHCNFFVVQPGPPARLL